MVIIPFTSLYPMCWIQNPIHKTLYFPHLYTILDFHGLGIYDHFIMAISQSTPRDPVTPLCLARDSPMGRQRGVSHFCINRQGFGFANAEGPPVATAPATSWGVVNHRKTHGKSHGKTLQGGAPRERNRVQIWGSHHSHFTHYGLCWWYICVVFMGFIHQYSKRSGGTTYSR